MVIKKYKLEKILTDEETNALNGKLLSSDAFKIVINNDADVYSIDGKLLLRFRKNVLSRKHINQFYENIVNFARKKISARGAASGSEIKKIGKNKKIMSNIYGYFDTWGIIHKHMFKRLGVKKPGPVRVTYFTREFPEKWAQAIPLIKDIDQLYKKLVPEQYAFQKEHADETAYKIPGTSFTTITTNMNTQMGCHKDRGNLNESFGNLVVIEKGNYQGGILGYPQYGVGVDVRTGDFLACDIHQMHGNTPIIFKSDDAERLSIVCYLRKGVWEKTRGSTQANVDKNIKMTKKILEKFKKLSISK